MTTETPTPIDLARTALLVMDYQNGILERVDRAALLDGAKDAIARVRDGGGTIGYVRVGFADGDHLAGMMAQRMAGEAARAMFHADAPATQIADEIAPQDGDIVVRKTRVGPFLTTDLDDQLRSRGIDTLILAGISTSGVLLSTVRDAHDRDYRLIVVSDLSADPEADVHEFLIERIFPRQAEVVTREELYARLS